MNKWIICLIVLIFSLSANAEQVTILNKDGTTSKVQATIITSAAVAAQYKGGGQQIAPPQANLNESLVCVQSVETTYTGSDFSESWLSSRCHEYTTGNDYVNISRISGGTAIWLVIGQTPVFDRNGNYMTTCFTAAGYWMMSDFPQFILLPNGQVKSTYCTGASGKG